MIKYYYRYNNFLNCYDVYEYFEELEHLALLARVKQEWKAVEIVNSHANIKTTEAIYD
jgi:glutaredoxin-related protein